MKKDFKILWCSQEPEGWPVNRLVEECFMVVHVETLPKTIRPIIKGVDSFETIQKINGHYWNDINIFSRLFK